MAVSLLRSLVLLVLIVWLGNALACRGEREDPEAPSGARGQLQAPAQPQGIEPTLDDADSRWKEGWAEASRRRELIKAEVARLGEGTWAGSYSLGDGLVSNRAVSCAPENGFVYAEYGDTGVYDLNLGAVREEGGALRFEPALLDRAAGADEDASRCPDSLFFVRWGERHYLLAESDVVPFCNAVNAGWEPRDGVFGDFYLRRGDEEKPARGRPELPERDRAMILEHPLEAEIVTVGEATFRKTIAAGFERERTLTTEVTLGAGAAQGVYEGLLLFTGEGVAQVTRVMLTSSIALCDEPIPAPGVVFSTLGAEKRPHARERADSPWFERALAERRSRISAEIAALADHPWAGTYLEGDGFDADRVLDLAPASGFAFRWYGCTGDTDRNMGRASEVNGRVRLAFEYPNFPDEHEGCAEEFVPVRWGERHYLVAADELVPFCNAVNLGWEPRHAPLGHVFLRTGDWDRPATGRPELPESCAKLLLDQPLETSVVTIGEVRMQGTDATPIRHTHLILGLGSRAGVFPGMAFRVGPERDLASVLVVADDSCEAILETLAESPAPEVGWIARTR